jgi:uncharacterized protein (TIGR03435 family)
MAASFICAALLCSVPCNAYAQAQAEKPAFDVASIKPMEEPFAGAGFGMGPGAAAGRPFIPAMGSLMGTLEFRPGNVGTSPIGITAAKLILEAYGLKPEQISGGPDWLNFDRFQLQAKAESAGEDRLRLMLQTLLAERFHMVTHHETRRMSVYFLVPAKSGPKLREWKRGGPVPTLPDDRHDNKFIERGPAAHLADLISSRPDVGLPVVDSTGLKGNYLFFVGWDQGGDFIGAMKRQLGLTLKPGRAPIDVLVIDRIDRPDAN